MKYKSDDYTIYTVESPSMRREWIEIFSEIPKSKSAMSPSMRREWIEISQV